MTCTCDLKSGECQAPEGCKAVAEVERLRAFIQSLDGKMICIMGEGDTVIDDGIIVADDIINPKS